MMVQIGQCCNIGYVAARGNWGARAFVFTYWKRKSGMQILRDKALK